MNRFVDYLRGLVADANLAGSPRRPSHPPRSPSLHQSLDYPTYLRRGLVIAGLGTASEAHNEAARGCGAASRH